MKDKCVICGEETAYDRHEHINNRTNYMEGSGQLCGNCHDRAYYNRHANDGTDEIAAFCFLAALICIVVAAIYNL